MIRDPAEKMTVEERATEMWRVQPTDLDRLGFTEAARFGRLALPGSPGSRERFYLAHLQAAVAQALAERDTP